MHVFGVCAHTPENGEADADPAAGAAAAPVPDVGVGKWRDGWFNVAVPTWDRDYRFWESQWV